jgi:hypothetical protein
VLEQYLKEAKILYPVEIRIRKINEIREKNRAGEQLTAEQYEKALQPVTSELIKTQDIIRKLTKMQETSPKDLSATSPENLQETLPAAIQETPSTTSYHTTISSIDRFLNDEFASAILAKHHLLSSLEMLNRTNHEKDKETLQYLATISKQLGGSKANSSGTEREEINKEIDVIKKYRELFKASQGTGFSFYKNAKDLLDRLEILIGQMIAGNDSVDIQNEAIAILDTLLREKKISKEDHEKLYEKIYSF